MPAKRLSMASKNYGQPVLSWSRQQYGASATEQLVRGENVTRLATMVDSKFALAPM
mgnify:CR=1 FL=1